MSVHYRGGAGFFVEDDGPGIPEDQRIHIFDAGVTTGDAGIGIGLAIVAGIVSAHDWEITAVEGAIGGARFEVTDVIVDLEENETGVGRSSV